MTRAASGHWYFTLKDDGAQVRCVMFRSRNALAEFTPRDGDEVDVFAQAGFYEPRGEFQLTVDSIAHAGGGRLFEEFLRLRDRLTLEGLFDTARKRALPGFPRAIGILTSLQAAALRDVLATLARRAGHVRLVVYPVPVQGAGAGARIATMLARASARAEVDVLLLVRGGGSIEDLWAFNEEVVARAIVASRLPVVVGVGHESDFTIADFAADVRAPTPTAAAELAAPDGAALLLSLAGRRRALARFLRHAVETRAQRLDHAMRVLSSPQAPLRALRGRVAELLGRGRRARDAVAGRDRARVLLAWQTLQRRRPAPARLRLATAALAARLRAASARTVPALSHRVDLLQRGLAQFDVGRVLARGFSIVRGPAGAIVTRSRDVQVGERLAIRFADGAASAEVDELE